jgi:MFS family permease
MENKIDRTPALLITASGSFLTPFMGSSVNVALPSIGREFSMDAILLSWVSTSYILSAAMFLVPMGRIADIHGRRKVFTQGILIFTIFSLLLGLGFALFSSPNTNAVMSSVNKKFYGVSSGTIATMRLIGQMLSMGMGLPCSLPYILAGCKLPLSPIPFFKERSNGLHNFCLPLHRRDFRLPGKGKSEIKMADRSSRIELKRFQMTDFGSVKK